MRMYQNIRFKDQNHFLNYCRKIVSNKMGLTNFIGRKKFSNMVCGMWATNDIEKIEVFLYRIKVATPQQIELSLRRLRGNNKPRKKAGPTGMYGIWSGVSKQFVFGIQEPSKRAAYRKLYKKIGKDSFKWRFEARLIKNSKFHQEMFRNDLVFKSEDKNSHSAKWPS